MYSTVYAASSPNYATSNEILLYKYNGYVQIKPSYNDHNRHAARGYLRYMIQDENTVYKDSGRQYTAYGSSANDGSIYSKSYTFYDIIGFGYPETEFFHGFTWVPHGIDEWPI